MTELPHLFCVKTTMGAREGFFLLRWSAGEMTPEGQVVHVLKPANHMGRFYNIHNREPNYLVNTHISRKGQGNITRPIHWHYTDKCLIDPGELTIPVLRVTSMTVLPAIKTTSFIPIVTTPVPAPVPPTVPVPANVVQRKKYNITSIPQHIIRILLTNAVLNSETCPITSADIDVSNGAITSCFHYFEKEAINKWLSMPNSKNECPLCKTPCNSYTLDS